MIKNDARYIIRRVIVFFAIFFIFSMISSCNVHAQETYTVNGVYSLYTNSMVDVSFTRPYNELEYILTSDETKYKKAINSLNYGKSYYLNYFTKLSNGTFDKYLNQYDSYAIFGNDSYNGTGIYFFNKEDIHFYKYNDNSISEANNPLHGVYKIIIMKGVKYNDNDKSYYNFNKFNTSNLNGNGYYVSNKNLVLYYNNISVHTMYVSSQDVIDSALGDTAIELPELNLIVNKTINDNIVTNYNFELDYSVFNTNDYKYYYQIGDNQRLQVLENNVTFNVNQNNTIYFTIYDNDNTLVYSQSFVITNLYQYGEDIDDYSVNYDYKNFSVDSNDSSLNKTIDRVTINFEYFPKRSIYKYQYQFVESGQSIGNFIDLGQNEYEKGYTTNVNGTLYNRILDSEDNVLYSSNFNVNSIGKLYLNENSENNNSFYNKLFSKINYGGSISDIFFLPVELIRIEEKAIREGFCTPVNLGRLFGHDLIMPCLDIESLVGSNIYYFIDMVFTISVIIGIVNFVVDCYNGAIFMEEGFDKAYNKMEGARK